MVELAARLLYGDSHTQPAVPTRDDPLPEGDPLGLLTVHSLGEASEALSQHDDGDKQPALYLY